MAELTTLARPYARAAFEAALADGDAGGWAGMLNTAAAVTGHEAVAATLIDPALSASQAAAALIEVCGDELNAKGQNFIRLLAENKRLMLLPQIAQLFDALKASHEKSVDVAITTAFQISKETTEKLSKALHSRLQREIRMTTEVDHSLIGGAVIRAGDTVIDSSVRGKLSRLTEAMSS
ncbi:MAG: F0F1 ATP synthase subunit delta [Pseudohongiellaceae bacterium]